MNKTLTTKSSNNRIVKLLMIMALGVLMMSGCQQVNDMVNGNKATNTNTTTNSNASANSNANSNVTANSNANANTNTSASPTNSAANANSQASNTAANTATASKEEVPLTQEAKVFAKGLVGTWADENIKVTFTEDNKLDVKRAKDNNFMSGGSYRILNENTVELNQINLPRATATMKIEDDGNTLSWKDPTGSYKFKRVK